MPQHTTAIGQVEHVNITVSDIVRSAQLFEKLMGWQQRWRGPSLHGGETIHVGDPEQGATYIAFYSDGENHAGQRKGRPMNHVGLVINDLTRAEQVVREAGLIPFGHDDYDPGRRFYFFDWDGVEFEVVSYA